LLHYIDLEIGSIVKYHSWERITVFFNFDHPHPKHFDTLKLETASSSKKLITHLTFIWCDYIHIQHHCESLKISFLRSFTVMSPTCLFISFVLHSLCLEGSCTHTFKMLI
jgi:hypothetical protein